MGTLKPFQVIVMGIFGFVALAGILLFANFQGFSSGVAQVGSVTIWGTVPASGMSAALNAFKQGHQEYASVQYVARPAATFDADLAEAIATGRGPDLILIQQEDLAAAQAKLSVIPSATLSERDFRDRYLPITELFLVAGGTYGIPFLVDPLVLYYNRPVLASAGATRPPSTWEAVSGLTSSVNLQTETQTVLKSLIALGTYENITNARGILSLLFLQTGNGITERAATGLRSSLTRAPSDSLGRPPVESALNFYTEFANPSKTVYSWNRSLDADRQTFLAGDLALYLGFASERAGLSAANPNLDFDMAPVPTPSTMSLRITYGRAYAFAIPLASKNKEGALMVAMTLSDKSSVGGFARATGMAPAHRAALAPNPNDLYESVYYPEALVARGWLSPSPAETDTIFATMIGNVASGRESVSTAISAAGQSLDAALK